jgi:hypothetical protein
MSKKETWTPEEEEVLRQKYPTTKNKVLSKELNRTVPSITMKAVRLKLVKQIDEDPIDDYENSFEVMTRDDAMKLDKFDLLRVNWSLLEMYRRELSNPRLGRKDRIKLMNALSNHTATINAIMKGSEDQLGEEEDLKAQFLSLQSEEKEREIIPRRIRFGGKTYVVKLDRKPEGKKNITK